MNDEIEERIYADAVFYHCREPMVVNAHGNLSCSCGKVFRVLRVRTAFEDVTGIEDSWGFGVGVSGWKPRPVVPVVWGKPPCT